MQAYYENLERQIAEAEQWVEDQATMFENPEAANRAFYVLFFQRRRQSLRQNVSFTGVSNKPRFLEISVV